MKADLGGATQACSVHRVRRMLLGELGEADAKAVRVHVAGCERCAAVVREVEAERARLQQDVPFDDFAAGVAEKLARPAQDPPQREAQVLRPRRWGRLVAGAGVVLAAAAALLLVPQRGSNDDGGLRSKGGAGAVVYAKRGAQTLLLGSPAHVLQGDQLLVTLEPDGMTHAVVLLAEPLVERIEVDLPEPGAKERPGAQGPLVVDLADEGTVSVLFQGPAPRGALPSAFEWTGSAAEADLIVVLGNHPLDAVALSAQAEHGDLHASLDRFETVLVRHLVRGR